MADPAVKSDVKQALLDRKVHLWEAPYSVEDKPNEDELKVSLTSSRAG
jgi:hypothetical protein